MRVCVHKLIKSQGHASNSAKIYRSFLDKEQVRQYCTNPLPKAIYKRIEAHIRGCFYFTQEH